MMGSRDDASALAAEWDQRYTSFAAQIPDGEPSAVLIAQVSGLPPGRALEIGCGIGADAIWLASHGWTVTGLDVSHVALERATARAREAGVEIEWVRSRLEDAHLPPKGFDLVTAHYPALLHSPGHSAETALLGAVAPGGTLLVVHHADIDVEKAKSHGFDPADYLSHDDIVKLLDDGWDVRVERHRPREKPTGIDLQHTHDDVLCARRR
jgi:SAM-dependent methyltransferase